MRATTIALATAAAVVVTVAASGCVAKRAPAWGAPGLPFGAVSEQILQDLVSAGDYAWKRRAEPGQLDAAARAGKSPVEVFTHAEPADAAALVVYAQALLDWSIAHGTPTLLKKREWIEAAAKRALAFDPAVGFAAPNRILGVLDCELPAAGQNLRDALERFEAAVAAAPAYLPTRIAYAEEYATRVRDKKLYERLLESVLDADPNALPEAAPENAEAQRTARRLIRGRR
jgi:hypothetical protein